MHLSYAFNTFIVTKAVVKNPTAIAASSLAFRRSSSLARSVAYKACAVCAPYVDTFLTGSWLQGSGWVMGTLGDGHLETGRETETNAQQACDHELLCAISHFKSPSI